MNPNAITTVQVPWNDLNRNLALDQGELDLSRFVGFPPGLFPVVAGDARRPFTDEFNVGVDHQLPGGVGVSISYHRTQQRDGLIIIDTARPSSAYTQVQRTYTDGGAAKTITVYTLAPSLATTRNRTIGNADIVNSDYNGVEFRVTKRMTSKWQMLGGVTFQKHTGFAHSGTFTNPGSSTDLNNPNYRLNRDNGAVFEDLPWTFKLSRSYKLPYDLTLAGNYQARAGDPLERTLVVTGLAQGSETVFVQQRGIDRVEPVKGLLDFRLAKQIAAGVCRIEPVFDIYNIFNANPVLSQNTGIGSTWGVPTLILAPRVIRLSIKVNF